MRVVRCTLRTIVLCVLLVSGFVSHAQVDKEFWFSVPYANRNHGFNFRASSDYYYEGGQPIYLRLSTLANPAMVTISTPANANGLDTVISIAANSTVTLDLTPYRSLVEVSQAYSTLMPQNGQEHVENKGIHIVSTDYITAYFENATVPNPEIFSLKGKNALGLEFYTPFQTKWANDPLHNYKSVEYKDMSWNGTGNYSSPDSAYSAFDIVASEDGTQVEITPSCDIVGHKKGETFVVVLNKGQVYSARAMSQGWENMTDGQVGKDDVLHYMVTTTRPSNNLSGSHVKASKPVSIMVKDDSVFPSDVERSGSCEDYVGDQIVPVTLLGTEYVVMRGMFGTTTSGATMHDWVFVVGVRDGTTVNYDGNSVTVNKGQTISLEVTSSYMHILTSDSVYAFHITGYDCEFASALLPPINKCTGSNSVGFTRSYGDFIQEKFYANILVRQGGEKSFESNGQIATLINNATFTPIPNSAWSFAQVVFDKTQMPKGAHYLSNNTTYFHFAFVNSTNYQWSKYSEWTDADVQLQGASYAYFSNYNEIDPKAVIVNNSNTIIQVPQGNQVQMAAMGGYKYSWVGEKWDETSKSWVALAPNYYLNKTTGYNPIFLGTAPIGKYKFTATITPACEAAVTEILNIEVIAPVAFNDVRDSLCEDTPSSGVGAGYDLANLADYIIGDYAKEGYYVDAWASALPPEMIIENVDAASQNTISSTKGVVTDNFANPSQTSANSSSLCLNMNLKNGYNSYDLSLGLSKPIQIKKGTIVSMKLKPDFSVNSLEWVAAQSSPLNIVMTLSDGTNSVSLSKPFTTTSWAVANDWETYSFDFSGVAQQNANYSSVLIEFSGDNNWWGFGLNINVDDLQLTNYIKSTDNLSISNNDTIYAVVKNNQFPYYSDTVMASFSVLAKGRLTTTVEVPAMCGTKGAVYECLDLTKYNTAIGGAYVAKRVWYEDATRYIKVRNAKCVDVSGDKTFYAEVKDSCGNVGSVHFNIIPIAEVNDATVDVCPSAGNPNTSDNVKLNNYISSILPNATGFTVEWFSDSLVTPADAFNPISVNDGQVFYAKVVGSSAQCPAIAKLTFNVTKIDDAVITAPDLCSNADAVTLSATPGGGSFTLDGAAISSFTFDPKTSTVGTHTLVYTLTSGECKVSTQKTFQVFGAPTASIAGPTAQIDFNTSTTLTASPNGGSNYTYAWSPAQYLSSTTVYNPTTTALTSTQQFCVTVTDQNTCSDEVCFTVNVKGAPLSIAINVNATSICLGNPVDLVSLTTGGLSPYTYAWSSSREGFTSTLESPSHTPTGLGDITYTVTVTDSQGQTATASKTINVAANPSIVFNNPASICQNAAITLAPTITGEGSSPVFAWTGSVLNAPLDGRTAVVNTTSNPGLYQVSLTVQNGTCSTTEQTSFTLIESPTATVDDIVGFCYGSAKQLNANPQGGKLPYTHLWTADNNYGTFSDTKVEDPTFTSITQAVYNLTYTVTDANGCSASAKLSGKELNRVPDAQIVEGAAIATCQSTNSYLLQGQENSNVFPGQYTYLWTGNAGITPYTSNLQNAILDISQPMTYNLQLKITDPVGCADSVSTTVVVNAIPTAQIIGDNEACAGTSLRLESYINDSVSNRYTYTWTANNASVSPANAYYTLFSSSYASSTPYSVTLTVKDNNTGCSANVTKEVTVKANPVVSIDDISLCYMSETDVNPSVFNTSASAQYRWLIDVTYLNSTTIKKPHFTAREKKDYHLALEVTDNGCSATDDMVIHTNSLPDANAGTDRVELSDIQFQLNGSPSGDYSYAWSPSDSIDGSSTVKDPLATVSEPTTFYLTVTDNATGCQDIDTVFVNVSNTNPTVSVDNVSRCGSGSVTLSAIPSGGTGIAGDYSYTWYAMPDETTVVGNNQTLTVTATSTVQYKVVMVNGPYTSIAPAYATVTVNAVPAVTVNPSPLETCVDKTLSIVPSGASTNVYTWLEGAVSTVSPTYTFVSTSAAGQYYLTLITKDSQTGCELTSNLTITVNANPTVSITPDNPNVCAETPILLTATADHAITSYTWTNGTATTSASNTFQFVSAAAQAHTVTVEVVDTKGCKASDSETIRVDATPSIDLPSDTIACTDQELKLYLNPGNKPGFTTPTWTSDYMNLLNITNPDVAVFKSSIFNDHDTPYFQYVYEMGKGTSCPKIDTINITVYKAPVVKLEDQHYCEWSSNNIIKPLEPKDLVQSSEYTYGFVWSGAVTQDPVQEQYARNLGKAVNTAGYPYSLTVAVNKVCSTTATANIYFHEKPVANITPDLQEAVPAKGQVTLTGEIFGNGLSPYYGIWSPSSVIKSVDSISSPEKYIMTSKPLMANPQSFTFRVVDARGCWSEDNITLKVYGGSSVIIVGDSTNKPRDPKQPLDSTVYPPKTLKYKKDYICMGDSITLIAGVSNSFVGSTYTYRWISSNDASFSATTASIKVSPTVNTNYRIEVTDITYNITFDYTFAVYVHATPLVYITPLAIPDVSAGQELILTGVSNVSITTGLWSGSGSLMLNAKDVPSVTFVAISRGTYDLTYSVTDVNGCSAQKSITIPVDPAKKIDARARDTVFCLDNGYHQLYVENAASDARYLWEEVSSKVGSQTGDKPYFKFPEAGIYTFVVSETSKNGEYEPDTVVVRVLPVVDLTNAIDGPQDLCEYQKGKYTIDEDVVSDQEIFWSWTVLSGNDKIVSYFADSITVKWGEWGNEALQLTASNKGCKSSITYPVTIHKTPVADFYVRPLDSATVKEIYVDHKADFDNRSFLYTYKEIDNRDLQYYWDFVGDGIHVEESFEPRYSYDQTGDFYPMLIAVDRTWGCRDTMVKTVHVVVNPKCDLKFPNTFTPTAKENASFTYGYSDGIVDKDYNLKIFNRWGQLLWETNNKLATWDGTFKGAVCKQDVYVYQCTATCETGKVIYANGDVTLLK